jgi:predicted ATPase
VLVVEDLHWSDRATLAWLAYVARRPDPARLLLLGTYRAVEALGQGQPLRAVLTELRQHGQCVELALDYLSAAAVTAYLAQRFGGPRLVAELARVLQQRTRGNPLLTAVVDELVQQQGGRGLEGWEVRASGHDHQRPADARALIELQLAHCSPQDQTLLAPRSVAGASSRPPRWRCIERADGEIEHGAQRCPSGQFLRRTGGGTGPMAR